MSPRRNNVANLAVRSDTHPGLWMDAYVATDDPGAKAETLRQAVDNKRPIDQYSHAFERWQASFVVATAAATARLRRARTTGRLVIGLGNKNVLEMGIRLDHTWGVPVLPGSALKGLASRTAHLDAGEGWSRPGADTKRGTAGEHQAFLFGTTDNAGAVIFHDAWWDPSSKEGPLDLDVMTVHHPDYYQTGNSPPSDMDSPNPVPFVTAAGTFLIALELRPGVDPSWLDTAFELLAHGLEHHGLGAKTNAGYGRMAFVDAPKVPSIEVDPAADVARLAAGNAADLVPELLDKYRALKDPVVLRSFADQAVRKLGQTWLKKKTDKAYVRQLLEAAGFPL
ncbi:MAG: type III-B CRISPR module RAMP protein Cmr6 [Deltaproteobacteria bacterium]|nr:type III-B CRISPR module RAMP protein Cmr6 [Deltaproteobacteria bacterium]